MRELEIVHKIAGIVSPSVIQHNLHQNHIPIKKLMPANKSEFLCWCLEICILNKYFRWFLSILKFETYCILSTWSFIGISIANLYHVTFH